MVRVVSLSGVNFTLPVDTRDDDHCVDCGKIDQAPLFLTPAEKEERREYQLQKLLRSLESPKALSLGRKIS